MSKAIKMNNKMSKFEKLMYFTGSNSTILDTKEDVCKTMLNIQKIAPVLGYGGELERLLGILRSASGAINKRAIAEALKIDTAVLQIFRSNYGNTAFINSKGQLIAETPMNIEVTIELLKYVANAWGIKLSERAFERLTKENVKRIYERAKEAATTQSKFENMSETSTEVDALA